MVTSDKKAASELTQARHSYEQCPYCDKIFDVSGLILAWEDTQLEKHIKDVHKKVKVRRGTNYKWMDMSEVSRLMDQS